MLGLIILLLLAGAAYYVYRHYTAKAKAVLDDLHDEFDALHDRLDEALKHLPKL